MEMIGTNEQFLFLRFIISGIIIFVVFRGIFYFLPIIFRQKIVRKRVSQYLPFAQTMFWILFLCWYLIQFSTANLLFSIVVMIALLGILFWLSKFALKDILAGMILRLTSGFKVGDVLRVAGQGGKLKNWTLLALELETTEGEIVRFPYSNLISESIVKAETKQFSSAFSFNFELSGEADLKIIPEQVSKYIVGLPWSSIHQKPEVSVTVQKDKQRICQITCFPIEKAFSKKIQEMVIGKFAQGIDNTQSTIGLKQ